MVHFVTFVLHSLRCKEVKINVSNNIVDGLWYFTLLWYLDVYWYIIVCTIKCHKSVFTI